MSVEHVPVLLEETVGGLALAPDVDSVDGTLGGAGHAEALLEATGPSGRLLGLDADPQAVDRAAIRLARYAERAVLVQGNFRRLVTIAAERGFAGVQGIVLDLGLSSHELAEGERGFSFLEPGPLDMRMDPQGSELTAGEIVNEWAEDDLADTIYRFGEEPRSRRIARAIVAARPLGTTTELAHVVARAVGGRQSRGRLHPATRVFQALRIQVNDELAALEEVLPQAVTLLRPDGRLAVITFHSLEDRIAKQFIQREARDCVCPPDLPVCRCGHRATLRAVTGKPIRPSEREIRENPRSRSAKLRIAQRL